MALTLAESPVFTATPTQLRGSATCRHTAQPNTALQSTVTLPSAHMCTACSPRAFHILSLFALETMQMAFSRNIFLSPESTTGSVVGSSAVRLLVNGCLLLGQLTHTGHGLKRRWRRRLGKSGGFTFAEHVRSVLVRHLCEFSARVSEKLPCKQPTVGATHSWASYVLILAQCA